MIVKQVAFGTQLVRFNNDRGSYVRLNISRRRLVRDRGVTAFANINTGRIRLVEKNATCTLLGTLANATKAIVSAY